MKSTISNSLCRFQICDEHLITDELVANAISTAFDEYRSFEFFPDRDIFERIKLGDPAEIFREKFLDIRNNMFDKASRGDQTVKNRFFSDTRLSSMVVYALAFFHRAIAEDDSAMILDRRIVLIKELPGVPTIYHISNESTVISHVGQGPQWTEIPTIYLGFNIISALIAEMRKGSDQLFNAFKLLLMVEERAIETGFSHKSDYPPEVSRSLNFLVNEVIKNSKQEIDVIEVPEKKPARKFTHASRKKILNGLNARVAGDEMNFDYRENLKAVKSLERFSRRYKKSDDCESLKEITRLLVAASGHDLHEIRNRANYIIERILAPKEFDAPLAEKFINLRVGETNNFEFSLPKIRTSYFLRIYKNTGNGEFFLEGEIDFEEVQLSYNDERDIYFCSYKFEEYGHYDFTVIRKKKKHIEWNKSRGSSGRVNVMPDLGGELILEIFADIHGHTKIYWKDNNEHPGLLYNENGEVIRLGNFSDVTAHLEDIKKRYSITAIYLLGCQKRGVNRQDWAAEASSPSPFSPMSLTDIEPTLGGKEEFKKLVEKAHGIDIKIIVDIVPHINRSSDYLPEDLTVKTYDYNGNLVVRSSTDGRYGSWNDGKLLNYRKFEVWEWLANSITSLMDDFDIDGIRFDSAHAVPIMMKKNNFPFVFDKARAPMEMVEGNIIVNEKEYDHYITTGFYDSACRDRIAVPLHFFIMQRVEKKLREKNKKFFLNIAECYWGHEKYLTRSGLVPYNSALFKICENIIHGKTDVREIYHIYDNYFPSTLPRGTELLGILGNHDERRALNTFGHRGLRAAVGFTVFMSSIIMDYEGSAEGEGWKVYLDNIYVNWNQFEYAAHRSLDDFYSGWYKFHRENPGKSYLVWANNNNVAAALKFTGDTIWLGAFNFADSNQNASIQFDNPSLPIDDDKYYRLTDELYSNITKQHGYFRGSELKISRVNTVISYTERVKLFKLEEIELEKHYQDILKDSFHRLYEISAVDTIFSNFSFLEISKHSKSYKGFTENIMNNLVPHFLKNNGNILEIGLKRAVFYLYRNNILSGKTLFNYFKRMTKESDEVLRKIGEELLLHNGRGAMVFMSAEAEPFSKSGGLANVVYELPKELVKLGEEVYVITGFYKNGSDAVQKKMMEAVKKHKVTYTGKNITFKIMDWEYEVGVHYGSVDGINYFLLDHHEFFDGLYWGMTSNEKLRRRVAFSRACAEVIVTFNLRPHYTFTNDAFAGIFNGIVRTDQFYINNSNFNRTTFLHIVHNGGWQYFDAYNRHENGFDLFSLFNLPAWNFNSFSDPVFPDRLSCMATGIRFSDRTITVSPSYAKQIEFACDGMEHILHDVLGISNAIGRDFRKKLNRRFKSSGFVDENYGELVEYIKGKKKLHEKVRGRYPELLKGINFIDRIDDKKRKSIIKRLKNKLILQFKRGLTVDPDLILFAMIHRISEQKGFQLLLDASEGIFKKLGFQAILGGAVSSGDKMGEDIAHGLYLLGQNYSNRVNVSFGFQEMTIPLLSSDFFGMPSMHEPGGIAQLEAFAAGCLVIARATGGLRDTVTPIRKRDDLIEGNGFLFYDYHPWAFYDAMERASEFFRDNNDELIHTARENAENSVYFWDKPAKEYVKKIYDMTETIRVIK
ncbi:glycogen/starch synthase [Spirochaetota bacterium]